MVAVIAEHGVGLLVISFFMAVFAFANFEATLSLLTESAFGYRDDANYLVFAFVGASLMIAQGVIYRRLVGRLTELTLARAGLLMMLLGLASLAAVAAVVSPDADSGLNMTWFLLTLFLAVCGFAFLNPSINALISRRSDPTRQGEILGVNQSASAMARILGPAIGNVLFRLTSRHQWPYMIAAAMLLMVLGLSVKLRRRRKTAIRHESQRHDCASPPQPRRIALIKPSALGDVVHSLPVLSALRDLGRIRTSPGSSIAPTSR